jgi:hypothetical protein
VKTLRYAWYKSCFQVKSPSNRLLVAVDQIDTQRLVHTAWKAGGHYPTTNWITAAAFAAQVFLLRNIWRTRRIMAVTISKPGKVEITSDS